MPGWNAMFTETVDQAAVWIEEDGWRCCIFTGRRHSDCIHQAYTEVPDVWRKARLQGKIRQGFMTSRGRLIDRAEGVRVALASGQLSSFKAELFSEDVIP